MLPIAISIKKSTDPVASNHEETRHCVGSVTLAAEDLSARRTRTRPRRKTDPRFMISTISFRPDEERASSHPAPVGETKFDFERRPVPLGPLGAAPG